MASLVASGVPATRKRGRHALAWFLVRRLGGGVLVLLGVTFLVYLLLFLTGDPVRAILPLDASPEQVQFTREQLGYDQPIPVQFFHFVSRAVQGDFGDSTNFRTAALPLMTDRLGSSLLLLAVSLVMAIVISVPLGVLGAVRKGRFADWVVGVVSMGSQTLPTFWLGIIVLLVFGERLGLFSITESEGLVGLLVPSFVISLSAVGGLTRLLRSSVLEVLSKDYIRTARAKGLPTRRILTAHVLRNACLPYLTFLGLQVGWVFSGSVVVEQVFSYPGIGTLAVQAVGNRDLPMLQVFVVFAAAIIVITNLLIDLVYARIDPRIRL
jgi:peptide/nickel transport system permease protein